MPASIDYREEARTKLSTALGEHTIYQLRALDNLGNIDSLPYTIKVLLESSDLRLDCHRSSPASEGQRPVDDPALHALVAAPL